MRILKQNTLLAIINDMVVDLPSPSNLNYLWGFGSILGLILVIQLASGIFLAMHYTANVDLAFISVEHIMRDVNFGWLLRYTHANGASFFFIIVFLHVGKALYHGGYTKPRQLLWSIGVIILVIMMATAFIGYVLPWGQMSFWGATVITNLLSAIPFVGEDIVQWLWGGFSIGNPTLSRFFSLHYLLPFILAGLALVHLIALHVNGSNNPLGVSGNIDKIPFHPYYSVKDLFGFSIFFIIFSLFIYFAPNVLGHADNYIPANPLVTPPHIQPEFYFLFAYTVLRSIPNKLLGVLALFGSLLVLLVMPYTHTSFIRSCQFRPIQKLFFWILIADFFILTYIGACAPEAPWVIIGQIASIYYFAYFLIITPLIGIFENKLLGFSKA